MKLLNKLKNAITRTPKKLLAVGLIAAALIVVPTVAKATWGPNRTTLDWNNVSQRGGFDHPVFNSFINTPYYGDERTFFDARPATAANTGTSNVDPLVSAAANDEIVLRTYVHNNGNQDLNASGSTVARNAKVKITLPTSGGLNQQATSYISADGLQTVTDTVDVSDTSSFQLEYVPDSARLYNNSNPSGFKLNDSIVSTGAAIGYDAMNGNLPGCFNYQAIVEVHVKIKKPAIKVTKQVRKAGETTWQKSVSAKPGDKLQWLITTYNSGKSNLNNTIVNDQLPPHLSVDANSVRYVDASQDVVQSDAPLFSSGIKSTATVLPDGGYYYRFDTTVLADEPQCITTIRNIAHVKSDQTPNDTTDYADVTITRENCNPPVVSLTCDSLDVTKVSETSYNFTTNATATGLTIDSYTYLVNNVIKQSGASKNFVFNETVAGNYTVSVSAKGGNTVASSTNCTKTVTINRPQVVFSCDSLKSTKINRTTYNFAAAATAKNVDITNYIYTVNGKEVQKSLNPLYAFNEDKPGEYTVAVSVTGSNADGVLTATSPSCIQKVTIEKEPETPVYSCDLVTVTKVNRNTYKYVVSTTATGGAKVKSYMYDFGDKADTADTVLTDKNEQTYTYVKDGTFTTHIKVTFKVNGKDVVKEGDACVKTVTVSPEVCALDSTLAKNDAKCVPCATNAAILTGDTRCTKATITTLPNTGAGSTIAIFLGASFIGAYLYRMRVLRSMN